MLRLTPCTLPILAAFLSLALTMGTTACTALPEENSGKDAYRHVAAELALGEWVVDSISYRNGDRTDWKFVMLPQPSGFVVEVTADNDDTEMTIGVYDRYGMRLAMASRDANTKVVKLQVKQTKRNGKHFVMVKATDGPDSDYQVRVNVGGASGTGGDSNLPEF